MMPVMKMNLAGVLRVSREGARISAESLVAEAGAGSRPRVMTG